MGENQGNRKRARNDRFLNVSMRQGFKSSCCAYIEGLRRSAEQDLGRRRWPGSRFGAVLREVGGRPAGLAGLGGQPLACELGTALSSLCAAGARVPPSLTMMPSTQASSPATQSHGAQPAVSF